MSIEEFLDGMPSFDERNFSKFNANSVQHKSVPVLIQTDDQPSAQTIVNDKSHLLLKCLHNSWGKKGGGKKRKLVEMDKESSDSSIRKYLRADSSDSSD